MGDVSAVFFTVHGDGCPNPRSVALVSAIMALDSATGMILSSCEGLTVKDVVPHDGSLLIGLYDEDYRVNRWSPRMSSEKGVPDWARRADFVVAVSKRRTMAIDGVIERAARDIVRMFSRGGEKPWETSTTVRTHPSRRGGHQRLPRYHHARTW